MKKAVKPSSDLEESMIKAARKSAIDMGTPDSISLWVPAKHFKKNGDLRESGYRYISKAFDKVKK